MNSNILSPDVDDLNHNRLVVLIEGEPLSNSYSQVLLTRAQFKLMSSLLESFMVHTKEKNFVVECGDRVFALDDSITSYKNDK